MSTTPSMFGKSAPWKRWGTELDAPTIAQMESACRLPITVGGALMPDGHVGYGLPIGGVPATRGAVIPYAVGVDIACRMKLSVLDIPTKALEHKHRRQQLADALEAQTRFGIGAHFKRPHEHAVMDMDWSVSPVTREGRDKAWKQLGTSGSGNHFVEFGLLTVSATPVSAPAGVGPAQGDPSSRGTSFTLPPGEYVALLSHSGSRGTGAAVCDRYSKLARELAGGDLPREFAQLGWLDLAGQPGQEYWRAMNLMGEYASANHAVIHRTIAEFLGCEVIAGVENHHNFAWRETHVIDGRPEELIVHHKGATPASAGVLGVIPGSMATPGFIVQGKGSAESFNSASHGAGRTMSRTKAREKYKHTHPARALESMGVMLLSAGRDELPGVYKDIHGVMEAQRDLVDVIARFDPRIVKMAPDGEKAED